MAEQQLKLDVLRPTPRLAPRRAKAGSEATLPRLTVAPVEAARMLGVSRDFFDEHIHPELRRIRRGSKTILIPVAELERWTRENAARWDE